MNIVNKVTLTIGVMASAMATTLFTAMPKPQIAQSYQANAAAVTNNGAAQLKAMKMCNTDFKDKSKTAKDEYRQLVFKAGTALGHPCPELIMLTHSDKNFACAGPHLICGKQGRGVEINQEELDRLSHGARRLIIYHEVAHLKERDATRGIELKKKVQQKCIDKVKAGISLDEACQQGKKEIADFDYQCEILADHYAALGAGCQKCSREFGDFFFKHSLSQKPHSIQLKNIQEMDFNALIILLTKLELQSKVYCAQTKDCHPLSIERAARFYCYALCDKIAGKQCSYHKQKAEDKAKKKEERAIAQKKDDAVSAYYKARRDQRWRELQNQAAAPAPVAKATPQIAPAQQPAVAQKGAAAHNKNADQVNVKHGAEAKPANNAATAAAPAHNKVEPTLFTKQELSKKTYNGKNVDSLLGQSINISDGWDFDTKSKFIRGEVVAALRTAGPCVYGVVLSHNPNNSVTIQVEFDTHKIVNAETVGKTTIPTSN